MARDFWQTIRQAVRIDKIKQSLTVPTGTYNCGFTRASLNIINNLSPLRLPSTITASSTALTVDFWAKFIPNQNAPVDFFFIQGSVAGKEIRMSLDSVLGTTKIVAITSGGTYTITLNQTFYHQWHRYSITFSSANNILKLYIDTVLVGSIATTGNLTDNTFNFSFGTSNAVNQASSFVNELAIYSQEQTAEEIVQTNSYKANIGAYGTVLVAYWKFNNLAAGGSLLNTTIPSVGAVSFDTGSSMGVQLVTSEYAPIKFGASFIAVQFDVSLGYQTSIQFPKNPPDGMTGEIVIRWIDEDNSVQRRKLWSLDGVDIGPSPALYNGERLAESFTIEIWNVDGAATVVIPSDIILRTAKCTKPTSSYDSTAQVAAAISANSLLAATFPITFPLTFSVQQTYTP